jgi:hypothetical protein
MLGSYCFGLKMQRQFNPIATQSLFYQPIPISFNPENKRSKENLKRGWVDKISL